ncbi:N/A [soil metagenome]
MNDLELLQAVAGNDNDAFGKIVAQHSGALFRLAKCLVGNRFDAEDVLQETFAGAFHAAGSFEGNSSVKTWLTAILIRQAARKRHQRRRYRCFSSLDAVDPGVDGNLHEAKSSKYAPDLERQIDVAAMVEALPDGQRDVVFLRDLLGMTYDEIKDVLGIPKGTVESRLYRARALLKTKLRSYQ